MKVLAIAATGMSAQQLNVEVIANNIANINTTSFKRARPEFTDLLYQTERSRGVPNRGGDGAVPEGASLGLGVRAAAIRNLHIQGALTNTANKLDLAIDGRGWFKITAPEGETLYARAGTFNTNGDGEMVTADGYRLDPVIRVPAEAIDISINESGLVFAKLEGQVQPRQLGQISLVNFANDAGLEPLGGNLYRETVASGQPNEGNPTSPGFGKLRQGYLEASNVDPVKEITALISAQRAYEMNAKVITAADQMAGTVATGIR
ncbi:flagellar basal-body rod protein FlgG [Bosea sp. BK604]|uniref:flagellar basal-body rod protein FlgG n=1 Tax=Bosea sp. BK604 TaxID=2512180 RepID=UPI0010531E27|nr:flagellar basal-body rod protein FlgG [Bosea sp. BK604]TCR63675.1 flagellar basal-body rod protein FlgG [Bosea sp. BK604]